MLADPVNPTTNTNNISINDNDLERGIQDLYEKLDPDHFDEDDKGCTLLV